MFAFRSTWRPSSRCVVTCGRAPALWPRGWRSASGPASELSDRGGDAGKRAREWERARWRGRGGGAQIPRRSFAVSRRRAARSSTGAPHLQIAADPIGSTEFRNYSITSGEAEVSQPIFMSCSVGRGTIPFGVARAESIPHPPPHVRALASSAETPPRQAT